MSIESLPVLIGPDQRILGLVTLPAARQTRYPSACLMMNAGVIHRIGPHRINVRLANALAAKGLPSVRVDLSGLGDSPHARTGAAGAEQAVADLRCVIDFMQRDYGVQRVFVIGLCSGAENGFRLALEDERVGALFMFDGFAYPTSRTVLIRRWTRLTRESWRKLAVTRWRLLTSHGGEDGGSETGSVTWGLPSSEFRRSMDRLVARGVAVHLAYSHSLGGFNYAGQLHDAFRGAQFLRHVAYSYVPHIDHTVTPKVAQQEFLDLVRNWLVGLPEWRQTS